MKKLIIILGLLVSLFFLGIERLNYLSQKEIKLDNFSTFNKVEIYTAYILMNVLGYPLYPEISKEAMLMLDPSVRDKEIHFESDFFLESKVVKEAINNYTKPTRLVWHPNSYVIGSPEARVSLTFNSGTLSIKNNIVSVSVPCTWPMHSDYRDHSYTTPLSVFPEIRVQEGLFWVLEKEGWIHPYTAIWKTSI
mgnify:FL=1|tara:strand:- start:2225 stop:2803 length:579 start_codon:yes stop_codon:yes gene_type:complete